MMWAEHRALMIAEFVLQQCGADFFDGGVVVRPVAMDPARGQGLFAGRERVGSPGFPAASAGVRVARIPRRPGAVCWGHWKRGDSGLHAPTGTFMVVRFCGFVGTLSERLGGGIYFSNGKGSLTFAATPSLLAWYILWWITAAPSSLDPWDRTRKPTALLLRPARAELRPLR
jgi:hypothetical protein